MASYLDTFAESLAPLPTDLGEAGQQALAALQDRGFTVVAGLTRALRPAITEMAAQSHIVEYCPKDPTAKRFATEQSTEQWLSKNGGRGMFVLVDHDRVAGYGWTGPEESDTVPGGETTFAVRIGEEGKGKGLARPFTTAIVAGSAALYGARNLWLETWGSNTKAVSAYGDVGFEYVTEIPSERPTLRPVGEVINGYTVFEGDKDGEPVNMVHDHRLYYRYPNELLPAPVTS